MENVHKEVNTMNKLNKSRFIDDKPEMVDNIKGDPFIEKMLELTDVISTVKFLTTRKGYAILMEHLLPIISDERYSSNNTMETFGDVRKSGNFVLYIVRNLKWNRESMPVLCPIIDTMIELKEEKVPFHVMRTTEHRGVVEDAMNDPDSVLPTMWAKTSIFVDRLEFYAAEGASEKQVICDLVCKLFELAESDSTDLIKGSDLVRIDYSDSKNSAYLQYANGRRKAVEFAGTDKKEMLVHLVNAIAETNN